MRIKPNKPKVVEYDMNTFISAGEAYERANIAKQNEDLTEVIDNEFLRNVRWAEKSIIREAEMGRYEVKLPFIILINSLLKGLSLEKD